MARVRPTASGWLLSVAEVLPLPHRANPPYTLGEAVAELGSYAQAVPSSDWDSLPFVKKNRLSLRTEIQAQAEDIGELLGALIACLLEDLRDDMNQEDVIAATARFHETWHSGAAIADAFHDLCAAAKVSGTTSHALQKLSAIIASQVGPAANGAFSLLGQAADALVDTEEDLARGGGVQLPEPLTEARRLEMATDILVAAPVGRVVVWVAYYRARLSRMRQVIGPMTFLRADWALPNALNPKLNTFVERTELREIHKKVRWLDNLHSEAQKAENQVTLVRVDLGERQVAGAVEEARHRIEALLSVAVEAGGASWRDAGTSVVLLDGRIRRSSLGLRDRQTPALKNDSYGISATAEILSNVADQLGDALDKGPMPEQLVEALTSLREARMTDHRDVLFFGAHRVTPRIATALEDHAMESLASMLGVPSKTLATALQRREALNIADRRIAARLMAPFNETGSHERYEDRQELEERISEYDSGGTLLVSVAKAVGLQDEIRALPMSNLQRADFEEAVAICTNTERERQLLEETWCEMDLLQSRQRRVRNAVNHGMPLSEITVNSIRNYANDTSTMALNIALTWFENGEPGVTLLQREENAWADRLNRISSGVSCDAEDSQTAG